MTTLLIGKKPNSNTALPPARIYCARTAKRFYAFKSDAISANWASAASRSSTISAAMISGAGRFALLFQAFVF